jgi:hypothetical protein
MAQQPRQFTRFKLNRMSGVVSVKNLRRTSYLAGSAQTNLYYMPTYRLQAHRFIKTRYSIYLAFRNLHPLAYLRYRFLRDPVEFALDVQQQLN